MNEEIAKLLEQNASNVCNSGTRSRLDIGGDKEVAKAWKLIQKEIKKIDKDFYEIIKDR
tara:strand:- start:2799 stop:2975 length:177 start_codon:yes stop_codon:yes gene_type:complete